MESFAQAFPTLSLEVADALVALNRKDVATQLQTARVKGVTFDNSADAGYIYVHSSGSVHGETICLEVAGMVNIDVGTDGQLHGVELVSPPGGLKAQLRQRASA
jgi:uncharacterized protein YuzE